MAVDLRDTLTWAMETLDVAREAVWSVEAADNTPEAECDAQVAYDAIAAILARAMAMLPPVEADDRI